MTKRIFTKQFDTFACESDTITARRDGFDLTARIYRDDCGDKPDERDCGFWPSLDPNSAGYIGKKSKSALARHMARAKRIMQAWRDDEWFYCGVAVTVSRNGVDLTDEFANALWGIECNYPSGRGRVNSYLRDVANELAGEALRDAERKLDELREDA